MLIKRQFYLDNLLKLKDKNLIKVITGLRRVGKSTLLKLFQQELLADGVAKNNIIVINFEERESVNLTDWKILHDEIMKLLSPKGMNYVFLDEVQMVKEFERMVGSLFVKPNIDLYITGSNAFLLSGELTTLLSGRYISMNLLPLSFSEYAQIFPELSVESLFRQYLNNSAMPEAAFLFRDAPDLANNYLRDIYETVINKDIKQRYQIRDMNSFKKVTRFVLDNVGSFVSANSIAEVLNVGNRNRDPDISHKTVDNYLHYLSESYFLYQADRYDIKGKNLLKTQNKYYLTDMGFRNALVGEKIEVDLGHKLENLVYLELRRRSNGDIWVGKHDVTEVDFVVQKLAGEREYYQVALTSVDKETMARELKPLQNIKDNYQKFLLTTDPDSGVYEGIRKINVIDWLLKGGK